MKKILYLSPLLLFAVVWAIFSNNSKSNHLVKEDMEEESYVGTEKATFGGGCFWCVEAIFERLQGVKSVKSGYSGGDTKNPSYKEVVSGSTNHAEVIQIIYNPEEVKFTELLEIFFAGHDPTTLNRQGADIGTQYRSIILFHNDEQRDQALEYIKRLDDSKEFSQAIVTQVVPFKIFYEAEDYHQDYYENNSYKPYCSIVIAPKIKKIEEKFKHRLKKNKTL